MVSQKSRLHVDELGHPPVGVQSYQRDQEQFRAIRPEDARWESFPPFPNEARLTVLIGDSTKAGPNVIIRVRLRSGEYITQVTAIGPPRLDYVDPPQDPRSPA